MESIRNTLITTVKSILDTVADDFHKLCIQNHLYGCFVLIESFDKQNGEEQPCELPPTADEISNILGSAGMKYGFFNNDVMTAITCKNSTEYIGAWDVFFKEIIRLTTCGDTTFNSALEEIEAELIKITITKFKDTRQAFFENALETGELNEEWNKMANEICTEYVSHTSIPVITITTDNLPSQLRPRQHLRKTKRNHGKRAITPIKRKHAPGKTRKRHGVILP